MEKLRDFRKSLNLSQDAMARKLGITVSMYEKVESGRAGVSSKFMRRFKKVFPRESIDKIFFSV